MYVWSDVYFKWYIFEVMHIWNYVVVVTYTWNISSDAYFKYWKRMFNVVCLFFLCLKRLYILDMWHDVKLPHEKNNDCYCSVAYKYAPLQIHTTSNTHHFKYTQLEIYITSNIHNLKYTSLQITHYFIYISFQIHITSNIHHFKYTSLNTHHFKYISLQIHIT